jgi:hypothetical protein
VARRLDAPRCEPVSHIFAFRPDEASAAGYLSVMARSIDGAALNKTAAALAELLAPPVTQLARACCMRCVFAVLLPCFCRGFDPFLHPFAAAQAYEGWEAAAAAAAAASLHGVAFAAVFPPSLSFADAAASVAFSALAAAPEQRGRVRFLRAMSPAGTAGAGTAPTLRVFKRDDADEPTLDFFAVPPSRKDGGADGHIDGEITQAGLARFLAVASLPLLPRYEFALRQRLEAAALPCLKLFLDDDGHNTDGASRVAGVRAAVVGAARALRGRVVAASYAGDASSYDMREFGLHREARPALGITADVAVYNATKWALPAPLRAPANDALADADGAPLRGWTATAERITAWAEQARAALRFHAHLLRAARRVRHPSISRCVVPIPLSPPPPQVLAGGVEPARVSELEPSPAEAAAEEGAADGVARLVYTSLRRDVLFRPHDARTHDAPQPRITLLELHASYFQKEHAKTFATLRRVARALRASGAQGIQVSGVR